MKKIRFIQTLATNREVFVKDAEYTVTDHDAAAAIRGGVAVEVVKPKPPEPKPKKPETKIELEVHLATDTKKV